MLRGSVCVCVCMCFLLFLLRIIIRLVRFILHVAAKNKSTEIYVLSNCVHTWGHSAAVRVCVCVTWVDEKRYFMHNSKHFQCASCLSQSIFLLRLSHCCVHPFSLNGGDCLYRLFFRFKTCYCCLALWGQFRIEWTNHVTKNGENI